MWFEPNFDCKFPDEDHSYAFPVGFAKPPGGQIGSNTHVLNEHTYCCDLPGACPEGEPLLSYGQKCFDWHQKKIGQRAMDAKRLGIPLIISEFGACVEKESCTREIEQIAEVCDEHLIGWGYW